MIEATTESAQLALDTLQQKPRTGIPSWIVHIMEHEIIDHFAGVPAGTYVKDPHETYLTMQRNIGTCLLDQYLAENPLTLGTHGYEGVEKGATQGADTVNVDGMSIASAEDVVEHLERVRLPRIRAEIDAFDAEAHRRGVVEKERELQRRIGPTMLKTGHGFVSFPGLAYGTYGYVDYFAAYALYPEVMERHFSLQADLCVLRNQALAEAYAHEDLVPLYRLDHDMADSSGTLASPESYERLWFPHFARSIRPLVDEGVRLLWHCDGNLMAMVPPLLEAGISGFQGFQYEDGMDYERICSMKAADGRDLIIIAGVSVTRSLPLGTARDVSREMRWLVDNGPPTGLFLGGSSSVAPGVPLANLEAMVEGIQYYRKKGRE